MGYNGILEGFNFDDEINRKEEKSNNSYFKTILLGLVEEIIRKYDGVSVEDKYGKSKFEDGKWLTFEEDKWKEMIWKTLSTDDLADEIELLIEALQKDNICIIGLSVNNTGII